MHLDWIVSGACLLASPGLGPGAGGEGERSIVFGLYSTSPVTTLDYVDAHDRGRMVVEAQLMEGLLGYDTAAADRLVPALAEKHDALDARTYVFHVRKGVLFHPHRHGDQPADREELTADDVAFSLMRAKSVDPPTAYLLQSVETVVAVGDGLLRIQLTKPDADLLPGLATSIGHVTCKEYYESLGDDDVERAEAFRKAPVGTGPYRLEEPLRDSEPITLVKFNSHWDREWARSSRSVDRVTFEYRADTFAMAEGLSSGDITMSTMLLADLGTGVNLDPNRVVRHELKPPFLSIVAFNLKKPYLQDSRLRRMINAAVDKTEALSICPSKGDDVPEEGTGYYLDIVCRNLDEGPSLPAFGDLDEIGSLQHLRDHGPLELMVLDKEDLIRDRLIESIRVDLDGYLGLKVRVTPEPAAVFLDRIYAEEPDFDLVYIDWTPDTPWNRGVGSVLNPLFNSESRTNYSRFRNEDVDIFLAQIKRLGDRRSQHNIFKKIQRVLLEEAPFIWLPTVRHDTVLFDRGHELRAGGSVLLYYTPFLKNVRVKE